MRSIIGIDLGGTQIKAGLIDAASGEVATRLMVPTRDGETEPDGLPAFASAVREVIAELEAQAGTNDLPVGLAAPGLADPDGSCIRWMPGRMHGIEGLHWGKLLNRPVRVLNDAQAALLGEVWVGAGQGCNDVIMLTLGTGVGGAVFAAGKLITGRMGRAGHLGHVSVSAEGARDAFNTPGSLEQAIGNLSIAERTKGRFSTTLELIAAAKEGDATALVYWERSVRVLAVALASLINAFDPQRVIIGGGITSGAGDLLFEPLRRFMDDYEWRPDGSATPVLAAAAGEWAGAIGAAWKL